MRCVACRLTITAAGPGLLAQAPAALLEHGVLLPKAGTSLLDAICVEYPYCKLQDVKAIDGRAVRASFPPEQVVAGDRGHAGVAVSELARHMAINGSVACALANPSPERHYYLAISGTFIGSQLRSGGYKAAAGGDKELAGQPGASPLQLPSNSVVSTCTRFGGGMAVAEAEAHGCQLRCRYLIKPHDQPSASSCDHDPQHYVSTPGLAALRLDPGRGASAVWQGARFPGHFNFNEHYAVAAITATWTELMHEAAGREFDIWYSTFQARRLVPAATPCVVGVERVPLPAKLPPQVAALPGAVCFHTTLLEQGASGAKPAVEALFVLQLA
jgi:hypothetical protein